MPPSRQRLLIECALVFAVLPLVLSIVKPHNGLYVVLWMTSLFAFIMLKRHHHYQLRKDWNFTAISHALINPMLKRFAGLAVLLFAFTILAVPERLFNLPLERPETWVLVMFLYPLLSVIPQEIVFRAYFFTRFQTVFSERALLILSSLAFGWMHVILQNWVAMLFSALGGFMFGSTYRKTNSLAAACLEHALYGCWVFTLGLGIYFYHGHAVR